MLSNRFQILKHLHTAIKSKSAVPIKSLKLYEHGHPVEVLKIEDEEIHATNDDQVLVKILAAPIHAIDLDYITGLKPAMYSTDKKFPLVPGTEGVAEIASIGDNVKDLSVGQRVVIPYANSVSARGTWSTYAIYDAKNILPVPQDMKVNDAAQLTFYPCAAYRVLKDFITLKHGDCVFFNGGNTPMGLALLQLCKARNLHCVCCVRSINSSDNSKNHLKILGADEVIPEGELMTSNVFETGEIPKPKLVINCVPRSSSKLLGKFIHRRGVMATFGFIAGYPAVTATAPLILKDFVQRPFWIVRYNENYPDKDERENMYNYLYQAILEETLNLRKLQAVPFMEYKTALEELSKLEGNRITQFLLDMRSVE